MSIESDIDEKGNPWWAGDDHSFPYTVVTGKEIEATANAAKDATSIVVRPLKEAIASAAKVRFPYGIVATLTTEAFVGDESLAVIALGGAVLRGAKGKKVQAITDWALEWVLRDGPAGAVQITKTTGDGITLTDAANGVPSVAITDQDTISMKAKTYFYTLRRTDDDNEVVLAYGDAVLRQPATRD